MGLFRYVLSHGQPPFLDPQGVSRCKALRVDVHQHKLMHAVLCRPFGSRVAETLLKRLEALIGEASDEDTLLLMQQVIALHCTGPSPKSWQGHEVTGSTDKW